jgi:hypothetical protein
VLDAAQPVPPRDADELAAERFAHGGCRDVVDEDYDTKVKIAEALEAAAQAVGDQPVERSDAAAIRAAEARAIGPGVAITGGVAQQAEAAARSNATAAHGEDKVTIGDVLRVRTCVSMRVVSGDLACTSDVSNRTDWYGVSVECDGEVADGQGGDEGGRGGRGGGRGGVCPR